MRKLTVMLLAAATVLVAGQAEAQRRRGYAPGARGPAYYAPDPYPRSGNPAYTQPGGPYGGTIGASTPNASGNLGGPSAGGGGGTN